MKKSISVRPKEHRGSIGVKGSIGGSIGVDKMRKMVSFKA